MLSARGDTTGEERMLVNGNGERLGDVLRTQPMRVLNELLAQTLRGFGEIGRQVGFDPLEALRMQVADPAHDVSLDSGPPADLRGRMPVSEQRDDLLVSG